MSARGDLFGRWAASCRGRAGTTRAPHWVVGSLTLLMSASLVAGCTAAPQSQPAATSSGTATPVAVAGSTTRPTPTPAGRPAVLTMRPASGASGVNPTAPVTVSVRGGRLSSVTMTNAAGVRVGGALAATGWHSTEPLGYGKSYSLTAKAIGEDGRSTVTTSSFSTLAPDNQTLPYLQVLGGAPMTSGASYGVAIVPVVHFDEPVTDRAAAVRALSVSSTPRVAGAWYWVDDQTVHYRPRAYWPAGTKVTVAANVYGVEVGPGLYGQSDVSASFTIGRRQLTVADDSAPAVDKVLVYDGAGRVIRTMNTSMGTHGGETVAGSYINFYTPGGTYTVLGHENPAMMCSASYGLPANAPGGYPCEPIYNSTKISTDGIYLHELDNTVWDQNNGYDVSHGCLNLDQANAVWFFQHSLAGDPVQIRPTKGAPAVTLSEGGDWSVPWSQWVSGAAVR